LLQLGTAEEVAATDHDRNLHATPGHLGDLLRQPIHHIRVHPDLAAAEHFTGHLEQDPLVRTGHLGGSLRIRGSG
jgi:hypothetical protein